MVLAFLLNSAYTLSIVFTVYTMVNALINLPAQRIMGATFMLLGITTFLLIPNEVPVLLMALFTMHMFKVIYAFSVDHYAK